MSGRDLTGCWDGIFNYPCTLPSNGFVAVLSERGGALTGDIAELTATITGERIGSGVRFTKRYADATRCHHAVLYTGTLAPEGDEMVGEWTIPSIWSGSFIMVRQPGSIVANEEEVGQAAH